MVLKGLWISTWRWNMRGSFTIRNINLFRPRSNKKSRNECSFKDFNWLIYFVFHFIILFSLTFFFYLILHKIQPETFFFILQYRSPRPFRFFLNLLSIFSPLFQPVSLLKTILWIIFQAIFIFYRQTLRFFKTVKEILKLRNYKLHSTQWIKENSKL